LISGKLAFIALVGSPQLVSGISSVICEAFILLNVSLPDFLYLPFFYAFADLRDVLLVV